MAWTVAGSIRGPQGEQGPKGDKGEKGEAGVGISIAGEVAEYADLPDDLGPEDAGNAYLVIADGKLYVWTGSQFPEDSEGSEFRGPQGEAGPANTLTIGTVATGTAAATITGSAPNQTLNLTIPKGDTGDAGPANSLSIGTVAQGTAAASITGTAPNQTLNLTIPKGDTGEAGARGSKWFTGSGVPDSPVGSVAGDMYLDIETGDVYQLS